VLTELVGVHSTGRLIVVTHGGVTTAALRALLGDEALRVRSPTLIGDGVPCCAITTLRTSGQTRSADSIAITDHL
jgi:broad specificity phosphatase PhoE